MSLTSAANRQIYMADMSSKERRCTVKTCYNQQKNYHVEIKEACFLAILYGVPLI